jgi:DNA-binding PucR family transcriptional regulator
MRAAAALYMSRNSFLSRLGRVNALIEEDLFDPKVRFRYELSLLLYDKWKER